MATTAIAILSSTGSVGKCTLDVVALHPDRYRVQALPAYTLVEELFEQWERFKPRMAVIGAEHAVDQLYRKCQAEELDIQVDCRPAALEAIASHSDVVTITASFVGVAGLMSALASAGAGKLIILASKESPVMSSQLLMQAANQAGALIMPVDSEHNAIFQSLPSTPSCVNIAEIVKILLTASGDPLRYCTIEGLDVVTPQQALTHPNWWKGSKITIDFTTLMNKELEVIEACQLFDVGADCVDVTVLSKSIIYSMASYQDGSEIAHMERPDMRAPIAHRLAWPERIDSGVAPLNFLELSNLHFEVPYTSCFPVLRLALDARREGGVAHAILNAANEVAVDVFQTTSVAFLQLAEVVEQTLSTSKISPASDLSTIIEADQTARESAHRLISTCAA